MKILTIDDISEMFKIIIIVLCCILLSVVLITFTSSFIHEMLIELGYVSDLYIVTCAIFIMTYVGSITIYNES